MAWWLTNLCSLNNLSNLGFNLCYLGVFILLFRNVVFGNAENFVVMIMIHAFGSPRLSIWQSEVRLWSHVWLYDVLFIPKKRHLPNYNILCQMLLISIKEVLLQSSSVMLQLRSVSITQLLQWVNMIPLVEADSYVFNTHCCLQTV